MKHSRLLGLSVALGFTATVALAPAALAVPGVATVGRPAALGHIPTAETPAPMSPVMFASSARGDLADMSKDLVDLQRAIDKGGLFRAMGNVLELSFNLGQLESLEPPTKIASTWNRELAKLKTAIDAVSASVSDGASVSTSKKRIAAVQSQIKKMDALIKKV